MSIRRLRARCFCDKRIDNEDIPVIGPCTTTSWIYALIWVATFAVGCGEVDESPVSGDSSHDRDAFGQTPAHTAAPTAWAISSGRHITVAAFEGWVNPDNGTWHVAMTGQERGSTGPWRTAAQPMWCALASGGGGEVGIASVEAPEAMLPGELPLPTACEGPEINSAPFEAFGAICGAVRVSSLLADETLENVYAEIFEFTGTDQQIGYRAPLGTGAEVPNEDYPLSQQYGLWSYGDIAPGESVDVVWTFRNNEPAGTEFRFTGRLVHEVRECTPDRGPNGIDDDCDGVIDNGCGIFEGGEACVVDADCFSGECETSLVDPDCVGPTCDTERRCTGACAAGLFGATCDQTCPGGAATPCSGNGTCDDGVDGSGLCTCDDGYAGADCSETCPGGVTCSGNGVCDTSGPTPTCVCDPLAEAHGSDCATTCSDGEQNGDEEGVDCGGPCVASCTSAPRPDVQAGSHHNCGLREDGELLCWGRNTIGQANVPTVPDGIGWTSFSVGYYHNCAERTDGEFMCWGSYQGAHLIPVLPDGVGWVSMNGGRMHTCGLATDDVPRCWGRDRNGSVAAIPALPNGVAWTHLVPLAGQTCGWATDGETRCWGENSWGVLPIPTLSADVSWATIVSGGRHMCGLDSDGWVHCWGDNNFGQLDVPALPAGESWTQIDAEGLNSCGVASDAMIRCWGEDLYQQSEVPPLAAELSWTDVRVGETHVCGRSSDGAWQCWGFGNHGQTNIPLELYD